MNSKSLRLLREWFKKNAASLPWRPSNLDAPRDPYAVWISETMLQQTQVSTVRDYFIKWMKRFPDVATLAKASEEEVFKYWQGLGYYSRARNILKTAKIVAGNISQKFPENRKDLEALPGIGAYTAGAILSLAYHEREAILDGNLVRIFSRLYALDFLPTDKNSAGKSPSEIYWGYAREMADSLKAYMHNEALMELGRTVCKVKNPECRVCPLRNACRAARENRTAEFPPAKKHVQKDWHGTVLVIESADHRIFAIHGGQKFFKNQFTLPHFESPRSATAGLPAQAEKYVDADAVQSVKNAGKFRHGITVHKMECDVLYVKLRTKAPKREQADSRWVERSRATEFFASSFCLKALEQALS